MKNIFWLLLLVIPTSFASAREYGMGGCGLGHMLMGKDGNQVLAITTNGTSMNQTFGISSGTSGCVDSGVIKKGKEARVFIENNQRQLANDISKGGGESVGALAKLYQCQDEVAFGSALQQNYNMIFPTATTSADEIEHSIQSLIQGKLASNCQRG